MRKSNEIPEGMQALYDKDGLLMGVSRIGQDVQPPRPARQITLHPIDYEIVVISYRRRKGQN